MKMWLKQEKEKQFWSQCLVYCIRWPSLQMITTGNTVFDFKEDRYTQGKTKEGFPQPWPRNEESAMGKNKTHTAKLLQQFINHCSAAAKSGSNVLGIRIHNTVFKRRVTTHFRQRLTSVLLLFSQHIANLF